MSADELKKLADELTAARERWHEDFEKWYDMAGFPSVEAHCETGFLITKLTTQGPTE